MLIDNKVSGFLVFENESVFRALEKINANKCRVVFVVAEGGKLTGSFSDGDFRRWVTSQDEIDLAKDVSIAMNENVSFCNVNDKREVIESQFSGVVDVIPLVDDNLKLVAVAFKNKTGIKIGEHVISEDGPVFIIAEIGNNHNGDLDLAKQLVDLAADANVDCAKFQMRNMDALYKSGEESDASADLGVQYTMDLLNKFQLTNEELIEIFDYCKSKGMVPLCTPWDLESLMILEDYGMQAYKVASADLTNHEFLESLAATGKPLICSTGMSTEAEIKKSVDLLKAKGSEFILLHCNSTYPAPLKDVNLEYLKRLKTIAGGVIGYSGHERGISIPVAATALGAKVIEKHFTIDKTMEGNDHKVSLLPDELSMMVSMIREVEQGLGLEEERVLSQGEMINREVLAKSLIVNRDIEEGTVITRDMVDIKSPGQGLQPCYIEQLIGVKVSRSMKADDYFFESDLAEGRVSAREYSFNRPFGIPVRYHDYYELSSKSNFDFIEFHLSYQDMNIQVDEFFDAKQDIGFAVHSPELFSGDHIMDLASGDEVYRERSIQELSRVCDVTRELKSIFSSTEKPVIVTNVGGFSKDGFLKESERQGLYDRVADALQRVNSDGVEVIIQTMPPFPWHFGGQSHHNLFVDADEISEFCEKYGFRVCFDVSHSMMACNYYHWNLIDFTRKIGKYVAHLHIVDAKGVDGEGVQIGKGDVDFSELSQVLDECSPGIQFIPEVWQGHKNSGEGFWDALEYLEDKL